MTGWEIYLWLKLDAIRTCLEAFAFTLALVISIGVGFAISGKVPWDGEYTLRGEPRQDDHGIGVRARKEKISSWARPLLVFSIPLFLFFLFFAIFIPSTKQYAVIYALPKIANNEEVQKLPSDALALIRAQVNKWTKEIGDEIHPKK